MNLDDVERFVNRSKGIIEQYSNMDEPNTKVKIIQPFIEEVLGWDMLNEVSLEYPVNIASGVKKADYAVIVEETPVVFIEAKGCDTRLNRKHKEQLTSYMRQIGVDWGLLTNGKMFKIYKRKIGSRRPDEYELGKVSLEKLVNNLKIIKVLSKNSIKSGESEKIAENIALKIQSIEKLKENKEELVNKIIALMAKEVGESITKDIESESKNFLDNVLQRLEKSSQQRTEINQLNKPIKIQPKDSIRKRSVRLGELVNAGLIENDEILYFCHLGGQIIEDEKARVLPNKNKVEYIKDGHEYSLSGLAKKIDIKIGRKHDDHSVAGPQYWKTTDDRLIDDLNEIVRKNRK